MYVSRIIHAKLALDPTKIRIKLYLPFPSATISHPLSPDRSAYHLPSFFQILPDRCYCHLTPIFQISPDRSACHLLTNGPKILTRRPASAWAGIPRYCTHLMFFTPSVGAMRELLGACAVRQAIGNRKRSMSDFFFKRIWHPDPQRLNFSYYCSPHSAWSWFLVNSVRVWFLLVWFWQCTFLQLCHELYIIETSVPEVGTTGDPFRPPEQRIVPPFRPPEWRTIHPFRSPERRTVHPVRHPE